MWAAIAAGVGLLTTILAWWINPGRRKTEELNRIFEALDDLYRRRDIALEKNDTDTLTVILDRIIELRNRKARLLQ